MQDYTDILLDDNGDLFTERGEAIGEAHWQDVWQLLRLTKGGLTHAAWLGCNLARWVQTCNTSDLKKNIKLAMRKSNIEISNDELNEIITQLSDE